MRYSDSTAYLESFWKFGIKLGLSRIEHLLALLGDPQKKIKSVHVAGTNGKGSVCVLTASALKEAGYKTGLYTSPHLLDYTERIKINGKDISKAGFAKMIGRIRSVIESRYSLKELPTEFELLTAAAFLYFAEEKVDIAVIETGLGGRLDSTNVLKPAVCAITNIDLDHCAVLGGTLSSIAKEKAGIIKRGVPVVTACDKPAAIRVIRTVCAKNGARLIRVSASLVRSDKRGTTLDMRAGQKRLKAVRLHFRGAYQAANAAVSLGILSELRRKGFVISEKALRQGFLSARWPARFQVVQKKPLAVLDGAHNPSGIRALFRELSGIAHNRLLSVVGMMKDKDHDGMMDEICARSDLVIAVAPDNPRSIEPGVLASGARARGTEALIADSPAKGFKKALEIAAPSDAICACGSLFVCADILRYCGHLTRFERIV